MIGHIAQILIYVQIDCDIFSKFECCHISVAPRPPPRAPFRTKLFSKCILCIQFMQSLSSMTFDKGYCEQSDVCSKTFMRLSLPSL